MQREQRPERLSGTQWNCSVPHWEDFKPHLACNLMVQCPGREDEAGCGYTTCGPDDSGFTVGDTCYVLSVLQPDFRLGSTTLEWNSYSDAVERCGRLGSMSEAGQLRKVVDFLWERTRTEVDVGLRTSDPGLPAL